MIKIGTRKSKLATIQSKIVLDYILNNGEDAKLVCMTTSGDKILNKSLAEIGGKGLFVKELDNALMDGRSDLSVHSLKDMPMIIPCEIPIIAYSKREDPRDALILPNGASGIDLSKPIGTSSLRRKIQIEKIYPGAKIKSLRGNILTRISKLDSGEYGAIILAAAGLKRLDLTSRITKYFSIDEMLPAAGQGTLAVQGRSGEIYTSLQGFNDPDTETESIAERAFVKHLNGGCTSPIAAHATVTGDNITIKGLYYDEETMRWHKDSISGNRSNAAVLGIQLAHAMHSIYE